MKRVLTLLGLSDLKVRVAKAGKDSPMRITTIPGSVRPVIAELRQRSQFMLACSLFFFLVACGGGGSTSGSPLPPAPTPRHLLIAVVGDSISRLQVLPDSSVPCTEQTCDYSTDGSHSWPTLLATNSGNTVVNLSSRGARTIAPFPGTTPVITQVASVPANADVVVWESGTNDTYAYDASAYASAINTALQAIRAQAPHARLVVVGVRYYNGSDASRIDAWNALEQQIAGSLFIDLRGHWSSGVSADWPDGTHPGQSAVAEIEQIVGAAL